MNWIRLAALTALCLFPLGFAQAQPLQLRIEGLDGALLENVRALTDIVIEQEREPVLDSRVRRLHARAPEQIRKALQPFGYYHAEVDAELARVDGGWVARYQVRPGPPTLWSGVEVTLGGAGAQDPEFARARAQPGLVVGERAEHAAYEDAKRRLLRLAGERGYLDAAWTQSELRVDLVRREAQAVLRLDTGPRFRFGELRFLQSAFDESYLRRFVRFAPGTPYSSRAVLALQTALSDTGHFQRVEVRPLREQAVDGVLPIEVELEPRTPSRWRFGVGYGTDTGARGTIQHTRRIGARGHVLAAELLGSRNRNSITGAYIIPWTDPVSEQIALSGRYSDETTDARTSRIIGTSVSLTQLRGGWREIASLNLERENYIVAGADEISQLLFPSVSWTRTRADDRVRPRRGERLRLELRGGLDDALSDTDFARAVLGAKYVRALGAGARLLTRADLGALTVNDFDALPASQRFYAGGDNSVRGYGFEALAPKNASGEVVGGRYLAVGSLEIEQDVHERWSVAAFYDAGNAFDEGQVSFARGTGVGLRWHSPVGPVRLDIAWPLDDPGSDYRVNLVIGPDL
jgi:translocation and assembly module TamA